MNTLSRIILNFREKWNMNWLQRLSQSFAPTYIGVGHNYRWNEETDEMEELWKAKDDEDVIIWYYQNGRLKEENYLRYHYDADMDFEAQGRIETGTGRGSAVFNHDNYSVNQRIVSSLINKYPGIRFSVYGNYNGVKGPMSLQKYWEMISGEGVY